MENKKITLSQAFKLYCSCNIVKFTIAVVLITVAVGVFFAVGIRQSGDKLEYLVLYMNSLLCYLASALSIFTSFDPKIGGVFYRTIKDCIGTYQKYHLASLLSGIAIVLLNSIAIGIGFSIMKECLFCALILLLFRAMANILCVVRRDIVRILLFVFTCIPVTIAALILSMMLDENRIKIEFGVMFIILAVSAAVIFFLSERFVLKQFRKNWYRD